MVLVIAADVEHQIAGFPVYSCRQYDVTPIRSSVGQGAVLALKLLLGKRFWLSPSYNAGYVFDQ